MSRFRGLLDEQTLERDLARYSVSDDEPTVEVVMSRSDAIWEAHERMRLGAYEAAGVWFLVAEGLQ